jgi:hypothetical protein
MTQAMSAEIEKMECELATMRRKHSGYCGVHALS